MNKRPSLLLLLALSLTACDSVESMDETPDASAVLVANGGNFSDQNGSVSRLSLEAGTVATTPAMDGFVQAVVPVDSLQLVLVNTFSGGRVDITDAAGTVRASVRDIDAPRAAVAVDGQAWVTTFAFDGTGFVHTIDVASGTLLASTPVGSYPEGIAYADGRLVVANYGYIGNGRSLTVVHAATGEANEVAIACDGPRDVVPAGAALAVVCLGKTVYNDDFSQILEQTGGQVHFLDAGTLATLDSVVFSHQLGSTGGGQGAAASPQELLVLDPGSQVVRRFSMETRQELPAWEFDNEGTYVGLSGIAFGADRWFVARLARAAGGAFPDYTSAGQLLELNPADGSVTAEYGVGPAPTHIALTSD